MVGSEHIEVDTRANMSDHQHGLGLCPGKTAEHCDAMTGLSCRNTGHDTGDMCHFSFL